MLSTLKLVAKADLTFDLFTPELCRRLHARNANRSLIFLWLYPKAMSEGPILIAFIRQKVTEQ